MDILKTYLSNVNGATKTRMVDSYKIITVNDKKFKIPFLIYDPDRLVLNSKTLMKLLMIKTLPSEMLCKLLNSSSPSVKKYADLVTSVSSILYEDRIFFDFDPYGNFLLSNTTKSKEIKEIITKTTTYQLLKTPSHSPTGYPVVPQTNTLQPASAANRSSIKQREELAVSNPQYRDFDFSRMVNPYGLEKVVFAGGGTKGIIYIGAYIGLLATGQVFYLNHFAGTSVGALSALVAGCITPTSSEYDTLKVMTLRDILTKECMIVDRYQEAMAFILERICKRNIDTFYAPPSYTWYGIWTAIDTIVKNNGLYDPQKSGFQIWYALICKKICQIMRNGLDKLIIIKKKDGTFVDFPDVVRPKFVVVENINEKINNTTDSAKDQIVQEREERKQPEDDHATAKKEYEKKYREYCGDIDIDTDQFAGWEIVKFFTFKEYYDLTNKTLVMTGTRTKKIETVYYTHSSREYADLSVMTGAMASMSIPYVFKAPVINESYNLDGGMYDNYPLTHLDKKVKDKITHYNNKIFGYLIDDKNSFIDAYEIIRELWMVYNGFIEIMNVGYLADAPNYVEISELFFEIRSEIYKFVYFTDVELETFLSRDASRERVSGFNITELEEMLDNIKAENDAKNIGFELPRVGIPFIEKHLRNLDSHYRNFESMFKIGRKTDLADVMDLAVRHGEAYNALAELISKDLSIISDRFEKSEIMKKYEYILKKLMENILSYYEIKGTFIRSNDMEFTSVHFSELMKRLYKKFKRFEELTVAAVIVVNKTKKKEDHIKNYIDNSIQIATTMISKVLTRGSGNNIDMDDLGMDKEKSSYSKALDYFFHTDMTGMMYKYLCIANDRICNDSLNNMRTIRLNTFETSTLHFDMNDELKARLIYEGYSKTVKYFTSLLHIMEITERPRPNAEYLESFELRYKRLIQ
jgi:predicted patatin/cPLA2 family phospholipase